MATSKSSKAAAEAEQYPALSGDHAAEVGQRSVDGSDGTRYIKHIVILARHWPGQGDGAYHQGNRAAVVNEAIQRGLHPRGDVSFVGAESHPDGESVTLAYSVETVPAVIDHRPQDATTPHDAIKGDGAA